MNVHRVSDRNIEEAARILAEGGIVIIPTDSNYCVVADPFCKEAVERIYWVKQMEQANHPLTLFLGLPTDSEKYAHSSPFFESLIEKLWPSQISFVLKKKRGVIPEYVTSNLDTVSLLHHEIDLIPQICDLIGGAICGSSANLSGRGSVFFLEEAIEQIGQEVDYILDNGPARVRHNNTVIDLTFDPPQVVRIGAVPLEIVREHIPNVVNDPGNYKKMLWSISNR